MMINFINSLAIRDFKPSEIQTDLLADFQSNKLGWLICWSMETPAGEDSYIVARSSPAAVPSTWSYSGLDISHWATAAQSAGNVDYAILILSWNRGFKTYPTIGQLNGGSQFTGKDSYNASIDLPQYEPYGINYPGLSGSQTIIDQFVTTFKAVGIKTGFYYNIGKDINNRGGFASEAVSAFDGTGNYRDYWNIFKTKGLHSAKTQYPSLTGDFSQFYRLYTEYVKTELSYLIKKYDIKYLWLDAVAWYPRVELKEIYNHIKRLNRNILVMHNLPPEDNTLYPDGTITNPPMTVSSDEIYLYQGSDPSCDIISYEDNRIPTAPSERQPTKIHRGISYYIPSEIVATSYQSSVYAYKSGVTVRTDLQTLYDDAKANSNPLLLSMSPKLDGTLDTNQINALSAITV